MRSSRKNKEGNVIITTTTIQHAFLGCRFNMSPVAGRKHDFPIPSKKRNKIRSKYHVTTGAFTV